MKKLILLPLTALILSTLSARENPFVPSQNYDEEVSRIMEVDENKIRENLEEKAYIKEIQKEINGVKEKIVEEKIYIQEIPQKVKVKTKIIKEPVEIVYVKPRTDITKYSSSKTVKNKLLPFLRTSYDNKTLNLYTKYRLIRKLTILDENKIVLDFRAIKNFYTKRESLSSNTFKHITVGNHRNSNYFRVVIKVSKSPKKFRISKKKGLVSISYLN